MAYPEYETIARQAYRLWEERGRPDGCDRECWFDAEAELHRQVWALAVPDGGPVVNNLDRSLAPAERRRVRAERSGGDGRISAAGSAPRDHFLVVLGRAHLRIYAVKQNEGMARAQFELAEAFDLEEGRQRYPAHDLDPAAGLVTERLPERMEHQRRLVAELTRRVAEFLAEHAAAAWDYAAGPALHHAVLERLPPEVRGRLELALAKELVHQSPGELRRHFALAANPG